MKAIDKPRYTLSTSTANSDWEVWSPRLWLVFPYNHSLTPTVSITSVLWLRKKRLTEVNSLASQRGSVNLIECTCQIHLELSSFQKRFSREKKLGYEAHSKIFRRVITFLQWQWLPACLNTSMATEPKMAKIDNNSPLLLPERYSLDQHRRWGLLRLHFLICSWTLEWGNGNNSFVCPLGTSQRLHKAPRFPSKVSETHVPEWPTWPDHLGQYQYKTKIFKWDLF